MPNKLNREYNQLRLNKVWCSDITYIRTATGWSYLATVFDLGTKEVVGHAMSQTADTDLVIKALDHAIGKHIPKTKQLMFHSDQGCQYTSKKLRKFLKERKITQSMSWRGNCWDNVVQERFFRNLKFEYLDDLVLLNHHAAELAVERYIRYYNNIRLNSAIGYKTPLQKRKELQKTG
ncbi:IS3 family transposase [Thorsellia kenyensis]|uniref:IS3 family transposase n=1 Tax=Thorsellia kenyensis TaxID=1549888 RepID=A0ABV6CB84_9GAMM